MADDDDTAWKKNLERTLYLAKIEAAQFSESTIANLQDKTLFAGDTYAIRGYAFASADATNRWDTISRAVENFDANQRMIIADDGDRAAYWLVDAENGTAMAMLPNGTGGGARGIRRKPAPIRNGDQPPRRLRFVCRPPGRRGLGGAGEDQGTLGQQRFHHDRYDGSARQREQDRCFAGL